MEQIAFLEAARSALKPGAGLFMCRVPNASSPLASHYRYVDWTHTSAFTKTSLDFVLYSAGFRDIEIVEATPNKLFPSVPLWIVRSLVRRAHRGACVRHRLEGGKAAANVGDYRRIGPLSA